MMVKIERTRTLSEMALFPKWKDMVLAKTS